jgi:mono/diheme cytochrome c family protein
MQMRHGLTAFTLVILCAQPVAAADADHGLVIAKRWCAECHVVAECQPRAKTDVLPFATIATLKTTKELTIFLADPHPKMPDMALTRQEIADIIAYMKTLGQAPNETQAPVEPKPSGEATPG